MRRVVLFFCVLLFSIVTNTSNLYAKEIENNLENYKSNKMGQIKPDKEKKYFNSNSSAEDIFGDEQTFPFVAGLGKNAAH